MKMLGAQNSVWRSRKCCHLLNAPLASFHHHVSHLHVLLKLSFLLLLLFNNHFDPIESTKLKLCHPIPRWQFYDIVSHLINQANHSESIQQFQISNQSIEQKTVLPDPQFIRSLFQQNNDGDFVTVIAFINLKDDRADTDVWLNNLENIYRSLVEQKSFKGVRFLLINSKDSYNVSWVERVRKHVSFEVYQDSNSSSIQELLDGVSGDIFVFDRCNLLAYYIRFPLSLINQRDPFFQATILAAHSDSPCKDKCIRTSMSNVNQTHLNETVRYTDIDAAFITTESTIASATTIQSDSETLSTINPQQEPPETSSLMADNLILNPGSNQEDDGALVNVLSQMGEVLQSFYDRYTISFNNENHKTDSAHPSSATVHMRSHDDTQRMMLNQTSADLLVKLGALSAPTVNDENNSNDDGQMVRKLASSTKLLTEGCDNKTICKEWTTEKLLAAKLCCLSFTTEDDDETKAMLNVNASDYIPSNGGFGCKLYARTSCSMIKPVLRCCTRKLVDEYFNYAIKLRQRKQQLKSLGQRPTASNFQRKQHEQEQLAKTTMVNAENLFQNLLNQQQLLKNQQQQDGRRQHRKRKMIMIL